MDNLSALLGALAVSIRSLWGPSYARLDAMEELIEILKLDYEIDRVEVYRDGRWMRDCWEGPYDENIQKCNYNKDIWYKYFVNPHIDDGATYVLDNYDTEYQYDHLGCKEKCGVCFDCKFDNVPVPDK